MLHFLTVFLKLFYFLMKKTVVFVYIPDDCIQQEFLIYFNCRMVGKSAGVFISFNVSKVTFCLDGTALAVQDSLFTFDIRMGCGFQIFPLFIGLHDLIFISIFLRIIFIKTICFVFTSAAVCTDVYFIRLGIIILQLFSVPVCFSSLSS